jgi:hypothetical protein
MTSARTSSTEAARERRRLKGEAQAVPEATMQAETTSTATTITATNEAESGSMQAATTNEPSEMPFDEMIKRELDHAMDLEIKEALNKIRKRQTALMCQESSLTDVIPDELGHDSDFYEDLIEAVQRNDPRVGDTKEEIYEYLAGFEFTRMRPLEALHEMYPVAQQQQQQQQQEQKQEEPKEKVD